MKILHTFLFANKNMKTSSGKWPRGEKFAKFQNLKLTIFDLDGQCRFRMCLFESAAERIKGKSLQTKAEGIVVF
jgi:hypothetical protein